MTAALAELYAAARDFASELAELAPTESSSLPPGWVEAFDETYQRQYWVNTTTRESSWTLPTE